MMTRAFIPSSPNAVIAASRIGAAVATPRPGAPPVEDHRYLAFGRRRRGATATGPAWTVVPWEPEAVGRRRDIECRADAYQGRVIGLVRVAGVMLVAALGEAGPARHFGIRRFSWRARSRRRFATKSMRTKRSRCQERHPGRLPSPRRQGLLPGKIGSDGGGTTMKRREIKSLAERFASLRHIAAIGRPARTSTRSQDGGGLNLAAGPATRCRD